MSNLYPDLNGDAAKSLASTLANTRSLAYIPGLAAWPSTN